MRRFRVASGVVVSSFVMALTSVLPASASTTPSPTAEWSMKLDSSYFAASGSQVHLAPIYYNFEGTELTSISEGVGAVPLATFEYNTAGQPTSMALASGGTYRYSYTSDGAVRSLTSLAGVTAASYAYGTDRPVSATHGLAWNPGLGLNPFRVRGSDGVVYMPALAARSNSDFALATSVPAGDVIGFVVALSCWTIESPVCGTLSLVVAGGILITDLVNGNSTNTSTCQQTPETPYFSGGGAIQFPGVVYCQRAAQGLGLNLEGIRQDRTNEVSYGYYCSACYDIEINAPGYDYTGAYNCHFTSVHFYEQNGSSTFESVPSDGYSTCGYA
jgi:YD repeat-containing protein